MKHCIKTLDDDGTSHRRERQSRHSTHCTDHAQPLHNESLQNILEPHKCVR